MLIRNSHEKVGETKRNFFSIMPSFKCYWVNKNHFGLYSKVAAGVGFLKNKSKNFELNKENDETNTYFMFQASFIGAEFGSKFRGFVELGVGDQGFALAGIRYKF